VGEKKNGFGKKWVKKKKKKVETRRRFPVFLKTQWTVVGEGWRRSAEMADKLEAMPGNGRVRREDKVREEITRNDLAHFSETGLSNSSVPPAEERDGNIAPQGKT